MKNLKSKILEYFAKRKTPNIEKESLEILQYQKSHIGKILDFVPQNIMQYSPSENEYYLKSGHKWERCNEGDYIVFTGGKWYVLKPDDMIYETISILWHNNKARKKVFESMRKHTLVILSIATLNLIFLFIAALYWIFN